MRKIFTLLALFIALCAHAQTSLNGRIYQNLNIMADVMDKAMTDADLEKAKADAIAKAEEEKGRKLTDKELAEMDEKVKEAQEMMEAMRKGMSIGISVEFKSEKDVVTKTSMKLDEAALKAAGIGWLKRKAIKAALALAPESEKGTYIVQNDLIIVTSKDDKDTLRLSSDGNQLFGKMDEKTDFTLTLKK